MSDDLGENLRGLGEDLRKLNLRQDGGFVDATTGNRISVRAIESPRGLVEGRIYPGCRSPRGIIDSFARRHIPREGAFGYLAIVNGNPNRFAIQYYQKNESQ
ncbi:MAG: hypothetical protein NUV97_01660 [archaeon]|nr:hypothetical protein [archaeon]MCR4323660.1 hypothetical protein [Nanoarchaeota archaeon]